MNVHNVYRPRLVNKDTVSRSCYDAKTSEVQEAERFLENDTGSVSTVPRDIKIQDESIETDTTRRNFIDCLEVLTHCFEYQRYQNQMMCHENRALISDRQNLLMNLEHLTQSYIIQSSTLNLLENYVNILSVILKNSMNNVFNLTQELKTQKRLHEAEINVFRSENKRYCFVRDVFASYVHQLRLELNQKQNQISRLECMVKCLNEQCSHDQTVIKSKNSFIHNLREELNRLKSKLHECADIDNRELLISKYGHVDQLMLEVEEKQKEISQLQSEVNTLKDQYTVNLTTTEESMLVIRNLKEEINLLRSKLNEGKLASDDLEFRFEESSYQLNASGHHHVTYDLQTCQGSSAITADVEHVKIKQTEVKRSENEADEEQLLKRFILQVISSKCYL